MYKLLSLNWIYEKDWGHMVVWLYLGLYHLTRRRPPLRTASLLVGCLAELSQYAHHSSEDCPSILEWPEWHLLSIPWKHNEWEILSSFMSVLTKSQVSIHRRISVTFLSSFSIFCQDTLHSVWTKKYITIWMYRVFYWMGMLGLQAWEVASQVALRNVPRKWGKKSGYIEVCNKGGQAVWTSKITVN